MKINRIFAAVAALACSAAFAQSTVNTDVGTRSDSAALNQGISLINNSYAQPLTSALVDSHWSTNQAQSAPPAFATPAVYRCATSGWGLSAQGVGAGIGLAGPGGVSDLCEIDFRMGLVKFIGTATGSEREIAQKLACTDDKLADAMEGTLLQCPAPKPNARKERWARAQSQPRADLVAPVQVGQLNLLP